MSTRRRSLHAAALLVIGFMTAGGVRAAVQPFTPARLPDPFPGIDGSYLVALDDRPRWGRGVDQPRSPASLTKLLTALVLLEDRRILAEDVTVTAAAAATEPTRMGLRAGDTLQGAQALAAMLVHSANDACLALVVHASADVRHFMARMNARARALGMHSSHFSDPCGYDAPGQYSTAMDLLRLARAAQADPLIARLVAQPSVAFQSRAGRAYHLSNTNLLLGRLEGVVGMKTGYTQKARRCLIALAERDGHRVWLVMLGSERRWWQAHQIIDAAFDAASFTTP